MQRQLRRGGGIMNIAPREQFGLGSKLKKFVRKVIPNEISKVATVAAPFVAPFNPALAGAMAGIGSFDQTGSISDALKRGALTYGGGQAARFIGGAGFQGNPFVQGGAFTPSGFTAGFSSPIGTQTGIGKLFKKSPEIEAISGSDFEQFKETPFGAGDALGGKMLTTGAKEGATQTITKAATESAPESVMKAIKNKDYGQAAKLAAEKGFNTIFKKPIRNNAGKIIGYDLDKNVLIAAGAFGLTYADAKKVADQEGVDIGTETEYDEATKDEFKEKYASYLTNFFGGKKDGGRIGFKDGTEDKELKKILATDSIISDSPNDPRNMTTNQIIAMIESGRSTPEMFEELLSRGYTGVDSIMLDEIGGKKLDKPQKAYSFRPDGESGVIEDFLFKLRESNPDVYGEYTRPRDFRPIDAPKFKAEGGRIGYMFGDKVEDKEGIMSMSEEDKEDENMKMAYFPGDVFTKDEIRRLFSDKSLTTNQDRKELYKILMNPGMFPEAEDMLIKLLRGNKDGGRIGFESGANKKFKFMELIEDKTNEKEKLINALLENAREKFPEASEEDIFNFVMSKAAPMSNLMVDGKFVRSTDIETPSIKLSKDMGGPRYDFLMGGEVPVRKNKAGIEELDYRQTGGFVPVGVKEKADDVPAMLSKNEFVLTADAVRGIGGGDVEKGAEKLYGVMKQAEKVGRA